MEKFKVDYSESSHFKGIRILFEYLEEGLQYAKKNNIVDVCVWTDGDWTKQKVDFSFLEKKEFIKTFHWLVPLSKKSNIFGAYNLSELEDLRWGGIGDFNFDLSHFKNLEKLNIGYGDKVTGWKNLPNLKRLMIGGVKTEDLSFLQDTTNLEYLRIIKGSFTSIKGIENCKNLKTLFLQSCSSLTDLNKTLKQLPSLEQLNLERCKKINTEQELSGIEIKNISII